MREKLLGATHADVALTLANLAVIAGALGTRAEANVLYSRALLIFDARLGSSHPRSATCRANYLSIRRPSEPSATAERSTNCDQRVGGERPCRIDHVVQRVPT